MRIFRIFLLIFIIPIPSTLAEYRAFQLVIENAETGKSRKVITTLDQKQYSTYFPLNSGERVAYVKSWMCWGTSDYYQDICPPPGEDSTENRLPASN